MKFATNYGLSYTSREETTLDPLKEQQYLGFRFDWAYENEDEALTYALQFGRGLERALGRRFVKMHVSELTKDMGDAGEKALRELFARAEKAGVVDKAPEFELIR